MTSSPESTSWVLPDLAGAPGIDAASAGGFPWTAPPATVEDWALPELPDPSVEDSAAAASAPRTALDEAYDRGRAEGMKQGLERAEQRILPALEALGQVTAALSAAQDEFARERARNLECLALAVARKLIQRELRADPTLVSDLVSRALELLPLDSVLELRLHPADLSALGGRLDQVVPQGRTLDIQWIPDPTLERGSFLVESQHRVVDGRTDVALRTLFERLDHE